MVSEGENRFFGKRALVLGFARQGIALARFLVARGAKVVVSDLRSEDDLSEARAKVEDLPIEFVLGGHPSTLLEGVDVLFLSAGVPFQAPIVQQALARGIPLSNDSQLFLELCSAPVVGITGSAGKTTTTALTGEMCRAGGRGTWVGGNIGRSMLPDLDEIEPDNLVVMELSSFQLEVMSRGTEVAAILNLTPNHLDRHKTIESYTAAKARLIDFQPAGGIAVLGRDDPGSWSLVSRVRGRCRSFSMYGEVPDGAFVRNSVITLRGPDGEMPVCHLDRLRLLGQHNVLNVLAAASLADSVGVPIEAIAQTCQVFTGVEHRLELVRERDGVRWYDDSIATAPERMMAALRSFDDPLIVLAGGRDKDLPWEEAAALIHQRVRDVVLFGEASDLIHAHLEDASGPAGKILRAEGLAQAVEMAAHLARPGDVVLLSPGGTSYDAYQDFEERGNHFKALVKSL